MNRFSRSGGKGEAAYRELKRLIMHLELAPGAMLYEADLMARLSLGRTPLREAIQRLTAEKLVVARARQTPFVAPVLAQELSEIVEMRLILEESAARLAAERGGEPERAALRAAGEAFHERVRANDIQGTLSSDAAIHRLIGTIARNSFLADSSERLASLSQRIWAMSIQGALREPDFADCHVALIAAICEGDAEAAADKAVTHVGLFRARLGRMLDADLPASRTVPHRAA